jgi:hypothetical protein
MDQEIERRIENLKRAPRCGALTSAGARCQRLAASLGQLSRNNDHWHYLAPFQISWCRRSIDAADFPSPKYAENVIFICERH